MNNPQWYYPSTKDEIEKILTSDQDKIFAAFDKHEFLFAFAIFVYSDLREFNLSKQYKKSVIIDDTVVHPHYQGKGWQKRLWLYGMQQFPPKTRFFCTIHPENRISLHNSTSLGFKIIGHGRPYDFNERLYLIKI